MYIRIVERDCKIVIVNASLCTDGFHGDTFLTIKLLLPGVIKSVYNLNDKQIVKLFSRIFNCNLEEMVRDLEQVRQENMLKEITQSS